MSHLPAIQPFLQQLAESIQQQTMQRLVLSRYQGEQDLQRITARLVDIKQIPHISFVYTYKTRDITKNLLVEQALEMISTCLEKEFRQANLLTDTKDIQLTISKKGKPLMSEAVLKTAQVKADNAEHNREKKRYLSLDRPFLVELGITDKQHQLIPSMSRKWKQINKFLEIIAGAIKNTGLDNKKGLKIADFGSGKAYLTFAVHDYLQNNLQLDAQIIGVELRQNLVDLCNNTVKKLDLTGLVFEQGDVQHYKSTGLDMMIALHACDTATDYAIYMGIQANAEIIICSPCCHKQLRPQMAMPPVLKPLLSHGIHMGQEAEMLTDTLWVMLLEAHGYEAQVFEFITLEHTSKNKMILATKRKKPKNKTEILQQVADIKAFYGIQEQCLESLLKEALNKPDSLMSP